MSWLSEFLGIDARQAQERAAQGQREEAARQTAAAAEQQAKAAESAAKQATFAEQMEGKYAAFDPQAFAAQQTQAAQQAAAAAARGAGANAGKAARLGNVGIGQAAANATGQAYGIQGDLANRALAARGGSTSAFGQGQERGTGASLGYAGSALDTEKETARKNEGMLRAIGDTGKTIISGFTGGGKAEGGEVKEGVGYIVGEEGEEGFVPKQDGTIIPNKIMKELSPAGKKMMKRFLDDVYPFMKKRKAA